MKHPILTNRVRFIVWWLVWLFLALGQSLLFYFAYGSFIQISILDSLISLIIYSGIALSLWFPFRYFNTGNAITLGLVSNLVASGALSVTPLGSDNEIYYDNSAAGTKQLCCLLGRNFSIQDRHRGLYLRDSQYLPTTFL